MIPSIQHASHRLRTRLRSRVRFVAWLGAVLLPVPLLMTVGPAIVMPPSSQARDAKACVAAGNPSASSWVKRIASPRPSDLGHRRGCAVGFVLPVEGAVVISPFRAPATPWSSGHRGIDLAVGENRILVAPADGRVSFVGSVGGKSVVSIDHGGYVSSLEPAADAPLVGTAVRAGERVAVAVGGSDHCGDSCVHWGVRTTSGEYVDPSSLIGSGVVLKPLEG